MAEATRLTTTGNFAEATALIQRLLQGGDIPEPARTGPASTAASPTIIDVEPVVLDDAEPQPTTKPKAKAAKPEPKPASGFTGKFHPKPRTGLAETLRDLAARAKTAQFDAGQFDMGKFDMGKFDIGKFDIGNFDIGGLSGLNGLGGAGLRPAAEPLPDGASFTTATFSNQAGSRDYKLYVPAKRTGQPMPLVVMLHGCTQSPDDFAAGTRMNALAEEQGCIVVYPQQPSSANAQKCWNWFTPNDQGRDRGEPSIIAGITRQIIAEHPVDATRVYVAGLSAGGAAAAIMGAAYPDLYAAVCVHSGLPVGAARDIPSAFAAMRQGGGGTGAASSRPVPTIVFHGDKDSTVNLRNGDAVVAQAKASASGLTSKVESGQATAPNGHGYSRTVHADASGKALCEQWTIKGAGHAWAGGSSSGSYTDPRGPDASREMLRFFFEHSL
jgi:poly(hydroxyalkanoate) depolymerase family esterase